MVWKISDRWTLLVYDCYIGKHVVINGKSFENGTNYSLLMSIVQREYCNCAFKDTIVVALTLLVVYKGLYIVTRVVLNMEHV